MKEQEWLLSQEPVPMMTTLSYHLKRARTKDGRRRLRLFGCACCRSLIHLFPDEPFWSVVDVAERLAEGAATQAELDAALEGAGPVRREGEADHVWQARNCLHVAVGRLRESAANTTDACFWIRTALHRLRADEAAEAAVQASLVRDIFGNPFRPLPAVDPAWLAWNGGAAVGLARTISAERRFEEMPVLADALEEAGCGDEHLLAHLRGPGPHCRGCHVIDLLTGRF
jgi:hypothetical protein